MVLGAGLSAVFMGGAHAHPDHSSTMGNEGFATGFLHPLGGLDHLLAMVAVGIWAAQLAADRSHGRSTAVWAVPVSFLAAMLFGGVLGLSFAGVPMLEQGIAASVFIIGILIALAVKPPLYIPVVLAAFFALFHGFAHGAELPAHASALSYSAGFLSATALLHAAGIGLGIFATSLLPAAIPRLAGAAIALCGAFLVYQTLP